MVELLWVAENIILDVLSHNNNFRYFEVFLYLSIKLVFLIVVWDYDLEGICVGCGLDDQLVIGCSLVEMTKPKGA
jgi:hypothetical protein